MDGLKVVEFGTYLAGPLLGRHLASLGCEVASVVRPAHARGCDIEKQYRRSMDGDLNSGKTLIELDLPRDLPKALELVREADILIENFSPGVMARLGVDESACRKVNRRLIYVSLPGYASADSDPSCVAWDSVIMATSGVFCDMGLNRTLLGVEASFSSLPMASAYASIFGLYAITSAVYGERWGERIEVPLASSLTEALVHNSMIFPKDKAYLCARSVCIADQSYPIDDSALRQLFDPFFCKYNCADGRSVYLVCPAHARHQLRALQILQIPTDILPKIDTYKESGFETGIGSANLNRDQSAALRPLIENAFMERPSVEWETLMGAAGVPLICHRTTREWLDDPHTTESGLWTEGRPAPVGWLREPCLAPHQGPSHSIHDDEIWLREVCDLCLSGIRVVDLTNVIAGPTIGKSLARMGADVVKIDPPNPTYSPEIAVIYGIDANMGKRSMLLDIMSEEGRLVLVRILRTAHILLVNCTNDALERAQLTRNHLREINPRLILMHFDAWGGPSNEGRLKNYVGYDDNVQAGIGIMTRFGGSIDEAEEHAHIGTIDVIAGIAGAAIAVHALLRLKKHNIVCTARTSLAAVGQYLQYPYMFDTSTVFGGGIHYKGIHPLHRCYRVRDAWVMLALSPERKSLDHAHDIVYTLTRGRDLDHLETCLQNMYYDELKGLLIGFRIGVAKLEKLQDVCNRNIVDCFEKYGKTYQYVSCPDHPVGHLLIAAPVALRMTGIRSSMLHAPKYGLHTRPILSQLRCTKLIVKGIASTAWSKMYLPFSSDCQLCHSRGGRLLILSCTHRLCRDCALRAMNTCPVCGIPHELDVFRLRASISKYKSDYNRWRKGEFRGSVDIERMRVPAIHLRKVVSLNDLTR